MKPGGAAAKGRAFESKISKELSSWITRGARQDVLLYVKGSGGRATRLSKSGVSLASQAGDIIAVHEEGLPLVDIFFIELKHGNEQYIRWLNLIHDKGKSGIRAHWLKSAVQAQQHHKLPVLIFRQNRCPIMMMLEGNGLVQLRCKSLVTSCYIVDAGQYRDMVYVLPYEKFLQKANPAFLNNKLALHGATDFS